MTKRDKLHARLAEAKQARMKEQDLGHLSWGETPVDAERIELTSRTIPETSHSSGGWLKNAFGKLQDSLSGRPKEMSPDEWRELKSKGQDKTYVDAKAREQEGENARTARLAAEAEQFADLSRLGQLGDPSAMKPYPAKRGNDVSGDSGVLEEDGWDEAPVSSPEQEGPQVTGHIGTSGSENSGTDEQSGGTGYLPSMASILPDFDLATFEEDPPKPSPTTTIASGSASSSVGSAQPTRPLTKRETLQARLVQTAQRRTEEQSLPAKPPPGPLTTEVEPIEPGPETGNIGSGSQPSFVQRMTNRVTNVVKPNYASLPSDMSLSQALRVRIGGTPEGWDAQTWRQQAAHESQQQAQARARTADQQRQATEARGLFGALPGDPGVGAPLDHGSWARAKSRGADFNLGVTQQVSDANAEILATVRQDHEPQNWQILSPADKEARFQERREELQQSNEKVQAWMAGNSSTPDGEVENPNTWADLDAPPTVRSQPPSAESKVEEWMARNAATPADQIEKPGEDSSSRGIFDKFMGLFSRRPSIAKAGTASAIPMPNFEEGEVLGGPRTTPSGDGPAAEASLAARKRDLVESAGHEGILDDRRPGKDHTALTDEQRVKIGSGMWTGYDPTRHLLPGEKRKPLPEMGLGAYEARFPMHEDPRFEPTEEYKKQLLMEEQQDAASEKARRARAPREMMRSGESRVPSTSTTPSAQPIAADFPDLSVEADEEAQLQAAIQSSLADQGGMRAQPEGDDEDTFRGLLRDHETRAWADPDGSGIRNFVAQQRRAAGKSPRDYSNRISRDHDKWDEIAKEGQGAIHGRLITGQSELLGRESTDPAQKGSSQARPSNGHWEGNNFILPSGGRIEEESGDAPVVSSESKPEATPNAAPSNPVPAPMDPAAEAKLRRQEAFDLAQRDTDPYGWSLLGKSERNVRARNMEKKLNKSQTTVNSWKAKNDEVLAGHPDGVLDPRDEADSLPLTMDDRGDLERQEATRTKVLTDSADLPNSDALMQSPEELQAAKAARSESSQLGYEMGPNHAYEHMRRPKLTRSEQQDRGLDRMWQPASRRFMGGKPAEASRPIALNGIGRGSDAPLAQSDSEEQQGSLVEGGEQSEAAREGMARNWQLYAEQREAAEPKISKSDYDSKTDQMRVLNNKLTKRKHTRWYDYLSLGITKAIRTSNWWNKKDRSTLAGLDEETKAGYRAEPSWSAGSGSTSVEQAGSVEDETQQREALDTNKPAPRPRAGYVTEPTEEVRWAAQTLGVNPNKIMAQNPRVRKQALAQAQRMRQGEAEEQEAHSKNDIHNEGIDEDARRRREDAFGMKDVYGAIDRVKVGATELGTVAINKAGELGAQASKAATELGTAAYNKAGELGTQAAEIGSNAYQAAGESLTDAKLKLMSSAPAVTAATEADVLKEQIQGRLAKVNEEPSKTQKAVAKVEKKKEQGVDAVVENLSKMHDGKAKGKLTKKVEEVQGNKNVQDAGRAWRTATGQETLKDKAYNAWDTVIDKSKETFALGKAGEKVKGARSNPQSQQTRAHVNEGKAEGKKFFSKAAIESKKLRSKVADSKGGADILNGFDKGANQFNRWIGNDAGRMGRAAVNKKSAMDRFAGMKKVFKFE